MLMLFTQVSCISLGSKADRETSISTLMAEEHSLVAEERVIQFGHIFAHNEHDKLTVSFLLAIALRRISGHGDDMIVAEVPDSSCDVITSISV